MTQEIKNEPLVAVYTISYNQCETVKKLFHDLVSQKYPSDRYEIIILDDGSSDATFKQLANLTMNCLITVKLIHCHHKEDYLNAKRWNQCIQAAESKTEVFIQIDDVRVRPDFIAQHVKWHTGRDDWLVTGAKFEGDSISWDISKCRRRSLAGPDGIASEIRASKAIWGASLSFTRKVMDRIYCPPYDIPYDERMVGWGYHEVEFAVRIKRSGVRLIYDPTAGVFHQNHTKVSERIRGLCRDEIIRDGEDKNIRYILKKHGLRELQGW